MNNAISALLIKDIEQIRKIFIFLVIVSLALIWLQVRLMDTNNLVVSYLSINSFYAMPILLAAAFVIGQHLITKEYYGHTQRFLEGLPIKRIHMAFTKYLVGLICLLILAFMVWGFSLKLASSMEPLSARFITIMAARLSLYVLALWSVVFTFSLLGRFRIPLAALCYFIISLTDTYTGFELDRFGPMALIESDLFSSERFNFPTQEMITSVIFSVLVVLISVGLIHIRDGSMVEKLASPISGKEKIFLLVVIVLGIGIFTSFDPEPDEVPFSMSNRFVVTEPRIQVSYLAQQLEPTAQKFAADLSLRLQQLERLVPFPSNEFAYQIHLSPSLEPHEYTIELISETQGMITTADFLENPRWSFEDFSAFIIHTTLSIKTQNRAISEPNHWLLDGTALWLSKHYNENTFTDSTNTNVNPYLLQAIYATQLVPINPKMVRQWDVTTNTIGDTLALSLAYSGLHFLNTEKGYDTTTQYLSNEYKRPVHGDLRDWWHDWLKPFPERFENATQWQWQEFVSEWKNYLHNLSLQPQYQQALKTLPLAEVSITPEITESGVKQIKYQLQLEKPLPANTFCKALHTLMPSFDINLSRDALTEENIQWQNNSFNSSSTTLEYFISGQYGSGSRIYTAIECEFENLVLPIRLGFSRMTMP